MKKVSTQSSSAEQGIFRSIETDHRIGSGEICNEILVLHAG